MLSYIEKEKCLKIVRESIKEELIINNEVSACPIEPVFKEKYGLFISIYKEEKLRGCIGYIVPYKPLYESLIELSKLAAFQDNRFKPVSIEEFDKLNFEISILSPLYEIKNIKEIVMGRDGLFIEHPKGSGILLPQIATKYNLSASEFLREICYKSGVDESILNDHKTKLYRFEAEIF